MSRNYHTGSGLKSNASTAMDDLDGKRLIFFTEYHFTASGVTEFRAALDKKLREKELEAYHEWVERYQAFRVTCIPGDARSVASIFRVILLDFIQKEVTPSNPEDEDDDETDWEPISTAFNPEESLSSDKIQRLAVWKNNLIPEQSVELDYLVVPRLPSIQSFPKEFEIFEYKEIWSCANEKETLDLIVPDNMLIELGQLTGCQFMKLSTEGKVFVASHTEEDCHRAISKLDNIRKYYNPQGCHTSHFFYTENEENVQFVLKLFHHVSKKLFKTTILDNLHVHIHKGDSDYENLFEAVRLRCAPYNQKKSLFVPILENNPKHSIEISNQAPGLKEWSRYRYSARGKPEECPAVVNFSNTAPINHETQASGTDQRHKRSNDRDTPIILWASSVPQINTEPIQMPVSHSVSNNLQHERPSWDTYKDWSKVELTQRKNEKISGVTLQTSSGLASNLAALKREIPTPQNQISQPIVRQATQLSRSQAQYGLKIDAQASASAISPKPMMLPQPNTLESNDAQLPPHLRSSMGLLQKPLTPQRPVPVPLKFSNALRALQAAPHRQRFNSAFPSSNCTTIGSLNPTPGISERCLLDEDIYDQSLPHEVLQPNRQSSERQQGIDEVSTRTFQVTMNQLAGRPNKKAFAGRMEVPESLNAPKKTLESSKDAADPLPDFVSDLNQAFDDMVTTLRGFQGELKIQVDFGRIILRHFHPKQLSDKEGEKVITHSASAIQHMLSTPTNAGPTCHFTSVVTTRSGEIFHVLAVKDESGNLLWEQNAASWQVVYEFTFIDKSSLGHNRFTIEVDAENFSTRVKMQHELGSIYIHGTKRQRDFRIAATGYKIKTERYSILATALEGSLWIGADKTEPDIHWVLEHSLLQQFDLEDLTVRRLCTFKQNNSKAVLTISELQALDVQGAWMAGCTARVFKGIPGPQERKPYQKLNSWHEMSISSMHASRVVEVNKGLELGEEAIWTSEDLLGSAWEMCSPACQMLKQIDSLGWQDENGVPLQATINRYTPKNKMPLTKQQEDHESFW